MLLKLSYILLTTKLLNLNPASRYILTNCSNDTCSLGYTHFQGQILANISYCKFDHRCIIFCEYFHPEGYTTTKINTGRLIQLPDEEMQRLSYCSKHRKFPEVSRKQNISILFSENTVPTTQANDKFQTWIEGAQNV